MNPKERPSIPGEQGAKTCLVHVDIGPHLGERDRVPHLLLKQAEDILKDTLVACARRHGGRLDSWKGHGGTFVFPADGPDGYGNCCLAAVRMLDELPSIEDVVRLAADLGGPMTIRVVCDAEVPHPGTESAAALRKHLPAVSVGNKVTITERVFRHLREPVKSRFQKWKRSAELGVELYTAAEPPPRAGPDPVDAPGGAERPAPERPTPGAAPPVPGGPAAGGSRFGVLGTRAVLGGAAASCLLLVALVRFWPAAAPPAGPPAAAAPPYSELVQSEDWRAWRHQFHEKLSAGNVTEGTVADALRIKLPARPEHAAAALRRDQAIGEVLMSYPPVAKILWDRFGIDEQNFLGTGLSKPSGASNNYGAASVHEYLIRNHFADRKDVWMRTLDPVGDNAALSKTVAELFEDGPGSDPRKAEQARAIAQRVKERRDTVPPAVIRFARFNAVEYSRQLGPKNRRFVFASNLAEVWDASVRDAANLSGYISKKGDTIFVWVFLPEHASEVVPATWDQVLNHLPAWLGEND